MKQGVFIHYPDAKKWVQIMYWSIPKLPISPPPPLRAFDWSFAQYSGEFDPKLGQPSLSFDFHVSIANKGIS